MSAKPVRSFQSDQGSLHEQAYLARPFGAFALAAVYLMTAVAGCAQRSDGEVIVYTALDEDFSRPLLDAFTERTGVSVRARYDTESTKSVQLTQTILAERERPRCDVFWNNELVNTLRLAQAGELASYRSPTGDGYPEQYRSDESLWYGFAARARVLLVNTDLAPIGRFPDSILALTDPEWKDQAAIAKPLAGTTATHAACLFAVWGEEKAQEFFQQVKQNARVLGGNKQVARAVATGQVAFGLTDTDDAIIEAESGAPVTIVYPDQAEEELGTLFIPNTLAILRDCPNRAEAEQLVEYLLSAAVERKLAAGPSAQIPLNPAVRRSTRVETPKTVRAMEVDFNAAADQWDAAARYLRDLFATAN